MTIDLDAYFRRIGYRGPRQAELEVLEAVHRAHVGAIPFESLNPLLGRPVELSPEALEDKLVHRRRGGYCFEQNGLFFLVLEALGIRATPLAARVRWKLPEDAPPSPLSHRIAIAHLTNGDFLCDVGFGGQNPPVPIRLEPDLEQETSHGDYRVTRHVQDYTLEMRLPEGWSPMYRFRLEAQSPRDYEVFNWYTATHPASRFVINLIVARLVGDKRLTLLNREFGVRHRDGRVERAELTAPAAVHESLARDFGIEIEREEIERVWLRLSGPV